MKWDNYQSYIYQASDNTLCIKDEAFGYALPDVSIELDNKINIQILETPDIGISYIVNIPKDFKEIGETIYNTVSKIIREVLKNA